MALCAPDRYDGQDAKQRKTPQPNAPQLVFDHRILLIAALYSFATGAFGAEYTNPLVIPGADPWVVRHEGWYYYTDTRVNRIELRRSKKLAELRDAESKTIWRAPHSGPNSRSIWAPELHRVKNRWFVYYTATDENQSDAKRRIYVLESETTDPFGAWRDRGKLIVPPAEDAYAIDGTLYQQRNGKLYFLWSGRDRSEAGPQNTFIAEMENPWTLRSPRVRISTPEYDWEKHGWAVNEGPQVLEHGNRLYVVYSASGYSTPHYCLGLLTYRGGNLLDAKAWQKSSTPIFTAVLDRSPKIYGPGHCSFFKSPDGREDWIIYHARDLEDIHKRPRDVRAQKFRWAVDGRPVFDRPLAPGVPTRAPSGE